MRLLFWAAFLVVALFLAAIVVPAHAFDPVIGTMPNNKGGGYIKFTDVPCIRGFNWIVYFTTSNGTAGHGCYFIMDDTVHVRWEDGTSTIYPLNRVMLNPRYVAEPHQEPKPTKGFR